MPCSDSSSSICLTLDADDRFRAFDFAKITCGREITAETGYSEFCRGKTLEEILALTYLEVAQALRLESEEASFVLFLEWDALRSAAAQYLGDSDLTADIDMDRCRITSIESGEEGTEIAQVILPPKEMPKILPCKLAEN